MALLITIFLQYAVHSNRFLYSRLEPDGHIAVSADLLVTQQTGDSLTYRPFSLVSYCFIKRHETRSVDLSSTRTGAAFTSLTDYSRTQK
jgi:hypothetical protein